MQNKFGSNSMMNIKYYFELVNLIKRMWWDQCITSVKSFEATYVGEIERSLKSRFNEPRRPSSTTSEVVKHIHTDQPEHTVELDKILKS